MKLLFANNANSQLASGITSVATTLTVVAAEGVKFPNPGASQQFIATLFDSAGNREVIYVTVRTVDVFTTIARGQEGTTAQAWLAGAGVEMRPTKGTAAAFAQLDDANIFTANQTIRNATATLALLALDDGVSSLAFYANLGAGAVNPLSVAQDLGIFFSDGAVDTGKFVLGGWSNSSFGIRFDNVAKTMTFAGASTFTGNQTIAPAAGDVLHSLNAADGASNIFVRFQDATVNKWYIQWVNASNALSIEEVGVASRATFTPAGGLQLGTPTGGDKGANALNSQGNIFQNNVQVATVSALSSTVLGVVAKRKTADESVTSSITLQDDDHLTFAIAANEEWVANFDLDVGAVLSTTGIRVSVTSPSGSTLNLVAEASAGSGSGADIYQKIRSTTSGGSLNFPAALFPGKSNGTICLRYWVLNGATPGNITFQFAQDTSSATAITARKGSYMLANRVA